MTADTVFKIDLSAELAEQTHGPDADDEDGEGEGDEMKVVKYRICGVGDGKMSRWAMLRGMFQTSILLTLLMASIGARNDLDKEKPLCLSMENAFTQRQFTSEKGAITSFASIDSSSVGTTGCFCKPAAAAASCSSASKSSASAFRSKVGFTSGLTSQLRKGLTSGPDDDDDRELIHDGSGGALVARTTGTTHRVRGLGSGGGRGGKSRS